MNRYGKSSFGAEASFAVLASTAATLLPLQTNEEITSSHIGKTLNKIKDVKSSNLPTNSKLKTIQQQFPNSSGECFPSKLHTIVSYPKFQNVITWLPHGRAFKVKNKKILEQIILPYYFNHSNYSSFQRQLNNWGFKKITYNCYYHDFFLRGLPELALEMHRPTKDELKQRKFEGNEVTKDMIKFFAANPLPEKMPQLLMMQIDDKEYSLKRSKACTTYTTSKTTEHLMKPSADMIVKQFQRIGSAEKDYTNVDATVMMKDQLQTMTIKAIECSSTQNV